VGGVVLVEDHERMCAMSLDVYLRIPGTKRVHDGSGIFFRDAGGTREITREEWDQKFPGREPVVFISGEESDEVFSANITHNLGRMADAAGIYQHLWRPEEIGITKASQLIDPLRQGVVLLKSDPPRFCAMNPENGWGSYAGFIPWIERYLQACEEFPDADVSVSR
jgi:hypothetical protein